MRGYEIAHATGDADVPVIQAAVTVSESDTYEAVLVGDDTDLLVLLIHLADVNEFDKEQTRGEHLWEYPFRTRLPVCDTTSRLFGIGKAAGLKLVKENETFREQAEVFRSVNSSKYQVIAAGEKAMTIVQKGKLNDHLDTMMYPRFQELVTTRKKAIHAHMLPPTSAATKYHSLRVFLQVQQWQRNTLAAEDWG